MNAFAIFTFHVKNAPQDLFCWHFHHHLRNFAPYRCIDISMINHNQSINALFFWCREAFENAHCESVLHIGWIDRFEFGRMRSDSVCCQFGWWFWCYGFFFCQRSANHWWIDRITCGSVLHCKSFCCWPQLFQHCEKSFLRWGKKKNGKHLKTVDYIYLELRLLSQYLWNKSVLIWEDTAKRAWTKTKTKMKQSKMNEAKLKPNRAHRHTLT